MWTTSNASTRWSETSAVCMTPPSLRCFARTNKLPHCDSNWMAEESRQALPPPAPPKQEATNRVSHAILNTITTILTRIVATSQRLSQQCPQDSGTRRCKEWYKYGAERRRKGGRTNSLAHSAIALNKQQRQLCPLLHCLHHPFLLLCPQQNHHHIRLIVDVNVTVNVTVIIARENAVEVEVVIVTVTKSEITEGSATFLIGHEEPTLTAETRDKDSGMNTVVVVAARIRIGAPRDSSGVRIRGLTLQGYWGYDNYTIIYFNFYFLPLLISYQPHHRKLWSWSHSAVVLRKRWHGIGGQVLTIVVGVVLDGPINHSKYSAMVCPLSEARFFDCLPLQGEKRTTTVQTS